MAQQFFIGLDLGTTSVKALAFNEKGMVLIKDAVTYPTYSPSPGWAEQKPDQIINAVGKCLTQLTSKLGISPIAIGISCAMHGLLAVDEKGRPMTNVLLWSDQRSAEQAELLRHNPEGKAIFQFTGAPIHAMLPLCKLAWWRENNPEVFSKAARWVSIKEYLVFKLTGEWLIDYSLASATGLFDTERQEWLPEALLWAGVKEQQLSSPVPTTMILPPPITKQRKLLGRYTETPLVIGASDGCLANLGAGVIQKGMVALTVGTSAALRAGSSHFSTDPLMRLFCYYLAEDCYVSGGPSNNGGNVWQWMASRFYHRSTGARQYTAMLDEAATAPVGSAGLTFLPYLFGERAPLWNAQATGGWFGLAAHHTRAHLLRAALEGMLYNIRLIGKHVTSITGNFDRIRLSGGLAHSPFFAQLTADIMGKQVEITQTEEQSALGAALLAMVATGRLGNIHDTIQLIEVKKTVLPNPEQSAKYAIYFNHFQQLIY